MTYWRIVLGATLLAVGAMGCVTNDAVRARFAEDTFCPVERVAVQPRPDLKPSRLIESDPSRQGPPADIANDPARLQMWLKSRHDGATMLDSWDVFEVQGCGVSRVLACVSQSKHPGRVTCTAVGRQPTP